MYEQSAHFLRFKSGIGPIIKDFVSEKVALGYKYTEGARMLGCFDQFLWTHGLLRCTLPEQLAREWTCKKNHESAVTHRVRFRLIRQLAQFMANRGYDAWLPDDHLEPLAPAQTNFAPYIFTHEEIARFLRAADELKPAYNSPARHLVMPEIFRVLYGCGLRVGEAIRLTLGDADLNRGILTIRQSKFRKDRLVPVAQGLISRLVLLREVLGPRPVGSPFFPSRKGRPYIRQGVYHAFRALLKRSGIAHRGVGSGPRVHDLRHTFAVHRMQAWYHEGADLTNRLPVLAAYMGHRNFGCTQRYMHLTLELNAAVSSRIEERYGSIIPRRKDR